jgi:hypothetical protein
MGLNHYNDMPPLDPGSDEEASDNEDNDHNEQVLVLHLPIYVSLGSEVRVRHSHEALQAFETALKVISTPATDPHLDIRPPSSSPPQAAARALATPTTAT